MTDKTKTNTNMNAAIMKDLTQHELLGLRHEYNLSDGHCHQGQSEEQKIIVAQLSQLWYESENLQQHQLDELFLDSFFAHQNQYAALHTPSMLLYASSIAIAITANYLMKKKYDVTLMTPCFDNLPDIFTSFDIPLSAIDESLLYDPAMIYQNLVEHCKTDALFVIDVNNPTGFSLIKTGKKAWKELIRYCKDYNKLLIIDFCFAPLLNCDPDCEMFDVYQLLIDSGISYVAYEDTGKVWPVQDAKASILKSSMNIYQDMHDIKTAYLLNVSPFILRFLTEYLRVSEKTNYFAVKTMIETNRALVKKYLAGTILETIDPMTYTTLSRNCINAEGVCATQLQSYLADCGVYVLPGTYFFWNDHSLGEKYIRIALSRNTKQFEQSMIALREGLLQFEKNISRNYSVC